MKCGVPALIWRSFHWEPQICLSPIFGCQKPRESTLMPSKLAQEAMMKMKRKSKKNAKNKFSKINEILYILMFILSLFDLLLNSENKSGNLIN